MNDTSKLRALAGQAWLEYASKQLADDIKTGEARITARRIEHRSHFLLDERVII